MAPSTKRVNLSSPSFGRSSTKPRRNRMRPRRAMMTSAIPSSETGTAEVPLVDRSAEETDTIPRIKVRDLVSAVQFLSRNDSPTLEALRVKLNADRRTLSGGTAGYSVARDVASELDRLDLAKVGPL